MAAAAYNSGHFRGKPLVLFFYQKDDTTVVNGESIAFTALADEFESAGAVSYRRCLPIP